MSLQDKIDQELGTLQQELSRLNNYTTEIGKAKQTAEAATTASGQILETGSALVQSFKELKVKSDEITKEAQEVLASIKSAQLVERMTALEQQGKILEESTQVVNKKLADIRALLIVTAVLVVVGVVFLSLV